MSAKILVVDDEPDMESLIRQRFRKQIRSGDYDFIFAGDGLEGIDAIKSECRFDAILSDINMPRMDGLKFLEHVREFDEDLLVSDKLASLGQLTAGVAHEIKNPLNFVNNFAALSLDLLDELQDELAPLRQGLGEEGRVSLDEIVDMLADNLSKIAEHGNRADSIVKSMLLHCREGTAETREVNVQDLVEEALGLAYHGARAEDGEFNVTLERHHDSAAAPLEVMPQELTRVLLNLIGNGFHAVHKKKLECGDPAYEPTLRVESSAHSDDRGH